MKPTIVLLLSAAFLFAVYDTVVLLRNQPINHIPFFYPVVLILFAIVAWRIERETTQPRTNRQQHDQD